MTNYKSIIAYMGQQKRRELGDDLSVMDTLGYSNYTDEVVSKIRSLFDAGKVDLRVRKVSAVGRLIPASIEWKNKSGQTHRENGPAVEFSDGLSYWYLNGQKEARYSPSDPSESYTIATPMHNALKYVSKEEYENYLRKTFPKAQQILP